MIKKGFLLAGAFLCSMVLSGCEFTFGTKSSGPSSQTSASTSVSASHISQEDENQKIAERAINRISVPIHVNDFYIELPALVQIEENESSLDIDIEWMATPAERFEFNKGGSSYLVSVDLPAPDEEHVEFKLTATAKHEGSTAIKVFDGFLMPTEKIEEKKISEVIAMEVDSTKFIYIRGVIRPTFGGSTSAIVTDETGSILVYNKEGIDTFKAGQTVVVKGTRGVNQKSVYDASGNKLDGVTVDNPELIYHSMIIANTEEKEIDMTSAVESTVEAINSWNTDPQSADFVNYSGKLFKLTCDIGKYAPIDYSYHVWEARQHGEVRPYLQLYCNSLVQDNIDAIDAYLTPFEGKQVTLGLMVYDFNSKYNSNKGTVKNTFRFVPVSVVAVA